MKGHEEKDIWEGSHNLRALGDENDHHGYEPLRNWDEPPSTQTTFEVI